MFNAKSKIVKYVGYGVIGFFILIIVIAFGMPDFLTSVGNQPGKYVANVNGENIGRLEFIRYRDQQMRNMNTAKMKKNMFEMYESMILSQYIQGILIKQLGQEMGIKITEDRRDDLIMSIPYFQDQQTKKFDYELFMQAIKQQHYSEPEFKSYIQDQMIKQDVTYYISTALAIPSHELKEEYRIQESSLQVKYAFLPAKTIKKQFKNSLIVTDAEIKAEMKADAKNIKNPKTDKKRIQKKLERQKLNDIKKNIVKNINSIAAKGGNFLTAAAQMKGAQISTTNEFKPGEAVKDIKNKKQNLYALYNSPVFRKGCLKLEKGRSSQAINAATGIYVFTPVKVNIFKGKIDNTKLAKLEKKLIDEQYGHIQQNIVKKLYEDAKIKRYLQKKQ